MQYLYYMPAPYSVTALHDDYCIQPICIICPHPIQSRSCIMIIALQLQPVGRERPARRRNSPLCSAWMRASRVAWLRFCCAPGRSGGGDRLLERAFIRS